MTGRAELIRLALVPAGFLSAAVAAIVVGLLERGGR